MKLGICAPYAKAEMAKNAGFDYFEYNCADLSKLTDGQYRELTALVNDLEFYSEALCIMLPGEIHVTGPDIDLERDVKPYLDKMLDRAAGIGCRKIVFGSARSRSMPEGFCDRAMAYRQLTDYVRMASALMKPYGMTLVIEPIASPDTTNILNFVSEGHYLMKRADCENVKLLADTYHMFMNHESMQEIEAYKDSICHLHMSSPDRMFPYAGDGFDYSAFFASVKKAGYDQTITVEAIHPEENCAERMKMACTMLRAGLAI